MKVPKFRAAANRNSGASSSKQPTKTSEDDRITPTGASPSCTTFILRSCKTGGYETGESAGFHADEDTINDSIFSSTDATSTQFAASWMDPGSVATERAVNSSAISKASVGVVSNASTLPMGSGKNPRTRRPRTNPALPNRYPPVEDSNSSAMDPGPLWRPATEESKVRRFSLKSASEESSNESVPVPLQFVDMSKGLDFDDETKQDDTPNGTRQPQRNTTQSASSKPVEHRNSRRDKVHGKKEQPAVSYRFEFGDVVLSNRSRRPVDLDDDVCGSIYSFSFSQDDEGTGFELDEFQEVWDGGSQANADSRDESSESSKSFDMESGMHMTDRDLMHNCNSPGAIRLTEEGLTKHEKDKFKESLQAQPDDPFEAWKHNHDARKYIRHRQAERQEKSFDPKVPADGGDVSAPPPPPPKHQQSQHSSSKRKHNVQKLMHFRKSNGAVDEGLADLSLEPLEDMEQHHLQRSPSFSKNRTEENKSLGLIKIFRKRSGRSSTAQTVLDREREFAEQEGTKKEDQRQKQERERIEAKRRAYLESQRSREGLLKPQNSQKDVLSSENSAATPSTVSSNRPTAKTNAQPAAASLPPCVVCHRGERTHIATPCMHFSFCAACAIRLGDQTEAACPVCFEPNVKFAAVSV